MNSQSTHLSTMGASISRAPATPLHRAEADRQRPRRIVPGAASSPRAGTELPAQLSSVAMLPGLISLTPSSGLELGPIRVGFYGIGFVLAVAVMILVSRSEARRRGVDPALVTNAVIVVAPVPSVVRTTWPALL